MEALKNVLILCDTEEEYAGLFAEYLRKQKEYLWEVHVYTEVSELLRAERAGNAAMLVVAERAYCEEMKHLQVKSIVILNESGMAQWDTEHNINKYQRADCVLRELLEIYANVTDARLPRADSKTGTKIVGMYSPVRRCHQTTFALTMSQLLAEDSPTLYLNFEHYAGITELIPDMQTRDLADLLYFLTAEENKFRLRFQTIVQKKGNLDYVPPMKSGQNLLGVKAEEWCGLLRQISEMGKYSYVILDLSESMQGLFDILRLCERVFTLTAEDKVAQSKIMQYEQILGLYDYEDILDKTRKCCPPRLRKIPEELILYTRSEMAEYVRKEIAEMTGKDGAAEWEKE